MFLSLFFLPVSKNSVEIFDQISLSKIVVVADNYSSDYGQILEAFESDLEKYNNWHKGEEIKMTAFLSLPTDYLTTNDKEIEEIVMKTYTKTRSELSIVSISKQIFLIIMSF